VVDGERTNVRQEQPDRIVFGGVPLWVGAVLEAPL
jgi:hypothetical protein